MTKVTVNPGNCGFTVSVTAEKGDRKKIHISLDTECEMVMKMADEISVLEMKALFTNILGNPVYRCASQHLQHTACPVPGAILKAAEVELGLCVAEDVKIQFEKESERSE